MEIATSLIETLKQACIVLNDADVRFSLVGGLAVGILARPRATEDIDLLVLMDAREKDALENLLHQAFEIVQSQDVMHFKKACKIILTSHEHGLRDSSIR